MSEYQLKYLFGNQKIKKNYLFYQLRKKYLLQLLQLSNCCKFFSPNFHLAKATNKQKYFNIDCSRYEENIFVLKNQKLN